MRRLASAWREWRQIRTRVDEERAFHLHRAAEDLQALGLSVRDARATARRRFGQSRSAALRELGGDARGLLQLLKDHQVTASALTQPACLLAVVAVLLLLSPDSRLAIESIAGMPLSAQDRASVFISSQAKNLRYQGISENDFAQLRRALRQVERYQSIHARAKLSGDLQKQLSAINPTLRAIPLFERASLPMAPAKALWAALLLTALAFTIRAARPWRWVVGGVATFALHLFAGLALWALALELWMRAPWPTDGRAALALLAVAFLCAGVAAVQTRLWWRDWQSRCPICFESLRLPMREGVEGNLLLRTPSCESICIYGHGVLEETRWTAHFRPERQHA